MADLLLLARYDAGRPLDRWPAGAGSVAGALILAWLALYWRRLPVLDGYEPSARLAAAARRFHSGVVNDYVTWIVLGLACLGGVFALIVS